MTELVGPHQNAQGLYRLVGASYLILRKEGKVLMARRFGTGWRDGWWSLPAGHIEWDEPCDRAAIREAEEEVGVRVEPADLIPLCAVHRTRLRRDPIDERADFFFTADRWNGDPYIREPHRCDGLEWFVLDALPDRVVPPVDQVLAGLLHGNLPPILTDGFR